MARSDVDGRDEEPLPAGRRGRAPAARLVHRYLHGIRKFDISRALARNRSFIRMRPLDQPEQPMPAQETDEA